MSKKKRIEVPLDPIKDKDIIEYLEQYGTTFAGSIRFILRQHINMSKMMVRAESEQFQDNSYQTKKEESPKKPTPAPEKESDKKRLPQFGEAFSSNNFNLDEDED